MHPVGPGAGVGVLPVLVGRGRGTTGRTPLDLLTTGTAMTGAATTSLVVAELGDGELGDGVGELTAGDGLPLSVIAGAAIVGVT